MRKAEGCFENAEEDFENAERSFKSAERKSFNAEGCFESAGGSFDGEMRIFFNAGGSSENEMLIIFNTEGGFVNTVDCFESTEGKTYNSERSFEGSEGRSFDAEGGFESAEGGFTMAEGGLGEAEGCIWGEGGGFGGLLGKNEGEGTDEGWPSVRISREGVFREVLFPEGECSDASVFGGVFSEYGEDVFFNVESGIYHSGMRGIEDLVSGGYGVGMCGGCFDYVAVGFPEFLRVVSEGFELKLGFVGLVEGFDFEQSDDPEQVFDLIVEALLRYGDGSFLGFGILGSGFLLGGVFWGEGSSSLHFPIYGGEVLDGFEGCSGGLECVYDSCGEGPERGEEGLAFVDGLGEEGFYLLHVCEGGAGLVAFFDKLIGLEFVSGRIVGGSVVRAVRDKFFKYRNIFGMSCFRY